MIDQSKRGGGSVQPPVDGTHVELLAAERLCKSFRGKTAVDNVSLRVAKGETVAFLGPNGAGKSTTLRMIAGYIDPDSGTVRINGLSVSAQRSRAQAALGYLAEGAPVHADLSVRAFLGFVGRAHGLEGSNRKAAMERVASEARIEAVFDRPVQDLSKGYRRRVALAGAMIHDPPVLVLDEPTDGLDPNQKQVMRDWLARLAPEKAILISTHQLDEVEAMCARTLVIAHGSVVADGPTREVLGDDPAAAFSRLTANTAPQGVAGRAQ